MKGSKEVVAQLCAEDLSTETVKNFRENLRGLAREIFFEVMAEEVLELCGPRHYPVSGARYRRAGSASGRIYWDGQWEKMSRPRVRRSGGGTGGEVNLRSYQAAKDPEEFRQRVYAALSAGASTRDQKAVAHAGRSTASRIWEKKGSEVLAEFRRRDISNREWACLMPDGVGLGDNLLAVVALGVTGEGEKVFLDFEFGAEESAETACGLLKRLRERCFKPAEGCRLLTVLDGSKALSAAVKRYFPDAVMQRCLVHKERNIRQHLPRRSWGLLAELFKRLRLAEGGHAAMESLKELEKFLKTRSKGAYESLREGWDELTAFQRLEVPSTLNISFLSTNFIENGFNNVRRKIGRVKRWRMETGQPEKWLAFALGEAEKGFKRIRNAGDMKTLMAALKRPTGD